MSKLALLFAVLGIVSVHASVYSQPEQKISLELRDTYLKNVLWAIEEQTSFTFMYNEEDLDKVGRIDVVMNGASVEEILTSVLRGTGLTYTVREGVIILKQQAQQPSRTVQITGRVTDDKKQAITGVTVIVKGTSIGAVTDQNGTYRIAAPNTSNIILVFSYMGMQTQEVAYTGQQTLDVVLRETAAEIDEVQIIAYGTRSKRDLINAISSVNAEEMKELPTDNLLSMLQGRMAGVQITQQGGAPGGGGQNIIIRGLSSIESQVGGSDGSPLFVIDGVPMYSFISPTTGSNALADLDPSTIESVEVLKDASSGGIYGSRAGNGVVLITTKRGKAGQANFTANFSFSTSHLPETPYQVLGRDERENAVYMLRNYLSTDAAHQWQYPTSYLDAYKQSGKYMYDWFWGEGGTMSNSDAMRFPMLQDSLNDSYNNNTNWWKKFFKPAKVYNANLQASGGTEKFTYMISGGFYKEEGINIGSQFSRASLLMNLGAKPNKFVSIDGRIHLSYTDKSRNNRAQVFAAAQKFEGISSNPSTTSSLDPADGSRLTAAMQQYLSTIAKNDNYRMMSNLRVGLNLYKELKFTTNLGIDFQQSNSNIFEPSSVTQQTTGNHSAGSVRRNIGITNENLLTFSHRFQDTHYIDLLAGLSLTSEEMHYIGGQAYLLASDKIQYVPDGSSSVTDGTADQSYTSDFVKKAMVSYFARAAYNYKRKYLVEFTYRRDGSSVFGENVKWANFPTAAVGWVFSDEPFMKSVKWLDLAKLRGSWGKSGQVFNDAYIAHGLMGSSGSWSMGTYVNAGNIINKNVTWEKTDQYNIGLDMDIFNYRVKLKLDYYYKNTKGLLQNVSLPGNFIGNNMQIQNAKGVSNEGIELEAIVDILRTTEVKWRTRFNFARNWNRFRNSYNGEDLDTQVLGMPLYNLKVYYDEGYYQNASEIPYIYLPNATSKPQMAGSQPVTMGMRKLRDFDGNGSITSADMYYMGSTLPAVTGGWTNELKWRDFDLSILFTFSLGRKMVNNYTYASLEPLMTGRIRPLFIDQGSTSFWEREGDNTELPLRRHYDDALQFSRLLRSCVENVHYMRLKQLTLGYNVPAAIAQKVKLNGVRVFFTGENLFLLHNYSGLDPEVVDMRTGIDNFESYPLARKWTLGVPIKF